jgi:prenyltransferase beta subunit
MKKNNKERILIEESLKKLSSAIIKNLITPELEKSLNFILNSKNDDGGWGRIRGSKSEARTTSLAFITLEEIGHELEEYERDKIEDFLLGLETKENSWAYSEDLEPDVISTSLVIQALFLMRHEKIETVENAASWIETNQNDDGGWGKRISKVSDTCAALQGLSFLPGFSKRRKLVTNGIKFLKTCQNSDGGWGLTKDYSSKVDHTSEVLIVLAQLGFDPNSKLIKRASKFLRLNQKTGGEWEDPERRGGNVFSTSRAIMAIISLNLDPQLDAIENAISHLRKCQNSDGGWSWKKGDTSEVAPTCYAVLALLRYGINDAVPLPYVLKVLKGTMEENVSLREQLRAIEVKIDSKVSEKIGETLRRQKELESELDRHRNERMILERSNRRIESLFEESQHYLGALNGQHLTTRKNLLFGFFLILTITLICVFSLRYELLLTAFEWAVLALSVSLAFILLTYYRIHPMDLRGIYRMREVFPYREFKTWGNTLSLQSDESKYHDWLMLRDQLFRSKIDGRMLDIFLDVLKRATLISVEERSRYLDYVETRLRSGNTDPYSTEIMLRIANKAILGQYSPRELDAYITELKSSFPLW